MKAKRKLRLTALLIAVILGAFGRPLNVQAADAAVTFGSSWYDKKSGDTFPVGVYLKSNQAIGDYHIEIEYDNLRLEYIDGADDADEENGVLILEGNQNSRRIKFWIRFKAISGGEAFVEVTFVEAALRNNADGELFNITEYASAPIHIRGTDTAAEIEAQMAAEALEAQRAAEEERERAEAERIEAERAEAERTETEAEQAETEHVDSGEDNSVVKDQETGEDKDPVKKEKRNYIFFNTYFIIVLAVVLLIVLIEMVVWGFIKIVRARRNRKETKRRKIEAERKKIAEKQKKSRMPAYSRIETVQHDLDKMKLIEFGTDETERRKELLKQMQEEEYELEWQLGRPIIRVNDVTMEFKMSSVNPSGLKEYIVQLIKREVSYHRLFALYHVSFNVYKGEVVGIIGTNGSGKSTLLKIVSGALKPTHGYVEITGGRKVQILTIGTGFDMELTARENVFLNGSIIGYRKEFLKEHYDEIVEFAELRDFMDEKVKNFSSGMVSRLGFAIATAGDAAEILILDEVLSVGDEFFRKKSLKRIKEMIHGGSTVLLVSHSMDTILENCSRCVWIEKGELQMAGDPKVVCGEYRRLNG